MMTHYKEHLCKVFIEIYLHDAELQSGRENIIICVYHMTLKKDV